MTMNDSNTTGGSGNGRGFRRRRTTRLFPAAAARLDSASVPSIPDLSPAGSRAQTAPTAVMTALSLIQQSGSAREPAVAVTRVAILAQAALVTWPEMWADPKAKLEAVAKGADSGAGIAHRQVWETVESMQVMGFEHPELLDLLHTCEAIIRPFAEASLVQAFKSADRLVNQRLDAARRRHGWRVVVWGVLGLLPVWRSQTARRYKDAVSRLHTAMSKQDDRRMDELKWEAENHGFAWEDALLVIRETSPQLLPAEDASAE
jgi:hypothetical protein